MSDEPTAAAPESGGSAPGGNHSSAERPRAMGPRLRHVLPQLLPHTFVFLMLAVGATALQAFEEGRLWGPGFQQLLRPYLPLLALAALVYPLTLLYRWSLLRRLSRRWRQELEQPEVLWLVEYRLATDTVHKRLLRRQALLGLTARGLVLVPYKGLPWLKLAAQEAVRVPLACLQTFETPAAGLVSLLWEAQPLQVHLDPRTTELHASRRRRGLEFRTLGSFAARDAFSAGLRRLREQAGGEAAQGMTENGPPPIK